MKSVLAISRCYVVINSNFNQNIRSFPVGGLRSPERGCWTSVGLCLLRIPPIATAHIPKLLFLPYHQREQGKHYFGIEVCTFILYPCMDEDVLVHENFNVSSSIFSIILPGALN